MKLSRIIIIIGGLLLASPALHAQDFLQKAKNYLDAGNCEKAQKAYDAYKVENPEGNEEVEQGIAKCLHADELTQTTLYMNEGKYVGEEMNGRPSGQGTLYYSSTDKEGRETYVGNWENGKRSGQGTMTWKSGDKYVGNWENDKRNGQGTYYYPSGNKYVGNWENGDRSGQGTHYWADGDVDKGTWVDDKRNGSFIRTTPSGKKSYATYSNGEMTVSWHE